MDFKLIDVELSEARLFRASRSFGAFDGKDIAHLLYLDTLLTYMLAQDEETSEAARSYAAQTSKFGTYSLFRTHAPDLYMLAYQVKHPKNDYVKLKDPIESKRHLENLPFAHRLHIMFLRKIAKGKDTRAEAVTYLFRLEKQMAVHDGRYRTWRRLVVDWPNLKFGTKQTMLAQMLQELRRRGGGAGKYIELSKNVEPMLKKAKYKNIARRDTTEPSTGKKVAGAIAGAIAGRYAANKLNKTSNKRAKNVGTGIGAIAGYWAAGRRKK